MLYWAGERFWEASDEQSGNGNADASKAPAHQALPFRYMEVAAE
jgi:hypothetical protein